MRRSTWNQCSQLTDVGRFGGCLIPFNVFFSPISIITHLVTLWVDVGDCPALQMAFQLTSELLVSWVGTGSVILRLMCRAWLSCACVSLCLQRPISDHYFPTPDHWSLVHFPPTRFIFITSWLYLQVRKGRNSHDSISSPGSSSHGNSRTLSRVISKEPGCN